MRNQKYRCSGGLDAVAVLRLQSALGTQKAPPDGWGGAFWCGIINGAVRRGWAGAVSGEPPPMGRRPVLSEGSQKPCVQR
jgi:hypothetical protein